MKDSPLIYIEKIEVHNHNHIDTAEILSLLNIIKLQNTKMANEIEDLTSEVSETKGIMQSAKTLIEGFASALAAAGTDKVKLAQLKSDLDAGSTELASAIAANPLPGEVVTPPTEGEPQP